MPHAAQRTRVAAALADVTTVEYDDDEEEEEVDDEEEVDEEEGGGACEIKTNLCPPVMYGRGRRPV